VREREERYRGESGDKQILVYQMLEEGKEQQGGEHTTRL
jgi:hypothetical protein